MNSVDILEKHIYIKFLLDFGFQIQQNNKDIPYLTKSCIRTDWQSTIYQCQLKMIKTTLKVLRLSLKSQTITKNFQRLGKGQFGQIYKFITKLGKYAIKNIVYQERNQDKLSKAFQEIILTKMASGLKVGSKFENLFGYDAIIFTDSVMFSMELCQQIQIRNQKEFQRLKFDVLGSLKVLHAFKICHLDIKTDNIVWSKSFKKYVLIDFGFSQALNEAPGIKTRTKYLGTIRYSSPEMRKTYYLESAALVDLYYNDVHGLKIVMSEYQDYRAVHQFNYEQFAIQQDCQQQQQIDSLSPIENIQIIFIYFLLKFHLFMGNFDDILCLLKQPKGPKETIHKLISCEMKKYNNQNAVYKLTEIKNISALKIAKQNSMSSLDGFLLDYTLRVQNELCIASPYQTLLQISEASNSVQLLKNIWLNHNWMIQIFNFLDVYTENQRSYNKNRANIIEDIHTLIFSTKLTKSNSLKFRDVLLTFFQYFQQMSDYISMMRILCYFILYNDMYEQLRMQKQILCIVKANILLYLKLNMEFFLAGLILSEKIDYISDTHNEQNLRELLSICKQSGQEQSFAQFISDSIAMMQYAKSKYSLFWQRQKIQESWSQVKDKYLSKYKSYINSDIRQLISYFLNINMGSQRQHNMKKLAKHKFLSQYLNCTVSKLLLYTGIQHDNIPEIRNIILKQPFLRQFTVFFHIFTGWHSRQIKKNLCLDFSVIFAHHCFQIQQTELAILQCYFKGNQYLNFLQSYLQNIKLYEDYESKRKILGSIYRVLFSLTDIFFLPDFRKDHSKYVRKANFLQLIEKVQTFFTEIQSQQGREKLAPQLHYYIQLNKSLISMIMWEWEKAVQMLIYLHQKYSQYMPVSFMARIYLSAQIPEILKSRISDILYDYLIRSLESHNYQIILYSYEFLQALISRVYIEKGLKLTYQLLKQCYKFVQRQQRYDVYTYCFRVFGRLSQVLSEPDMIFLMKQILYAESLSTLGQCPIIVVFILKITSFVFDLLTEEIRTKMIFTCAFFAVKLSMGIFRDFKNVLHVYSMKVLGKDKWGNYPVNLFRNKIVMKNKLSQIKWKLSNKKKQSKPYLILQEKLEIILKHISSPSKNLNL